jgi:hypothetical protein
MKQTRGNHPKAGAVAREKAKGGTDMGRKKNKPCPPSPSRFRRWLDDVRVEVLFWLGFRFFPAALKFFIHVVLPVSGIFLGRWLARAIHG